MASCDNCGRRAVFAEPNLCPDHFCSYFENKVKDTIMRYQLIEGKERIVVAVSGGKDSLAVLYCLKKFGYEVTGLAVDEGIEGYRSHTLVDLRRFCDKYQVPLQVVNFVDQVGLTMDAAVAARPNKTPCHSCGVLRRYVLNTSAKDFDLIATGHNLDDEAQVVVMNVINGNIGLAARLGPKTGVTSIEGFTQRIKPLYFCTEKEVMTYAFLKGFTSRFSECPYASESLRFRVREALNELELEHPGMKRCIIENFIKLLPSLKHKYAHSSVPAKCVHCGEPSTNDVCNACRTRDELQNLIKIS